MSDVSSILPDDEPNDSKETISVAELDALVKSIMDKREEIDRLETIVSEHNKELSSLKEKIVSTLKALDREKYTSPYGTVYQREINSLSTPKTWEEKEALMEFIKSKSGEDGVRDFITFNNKKLVSFAKAEVDAREQEGDLNRSIPGCGDLKIFIDLGVRKA